MRKAQFMAMLPLSCLAVSLGLGAQQEKTKDPAPLPRPCPEAVAPGGILTFVHLIPSNAPAFPIEPKKPISLPDPDWVMRRNAWPTDGQFARRKLLRVVRDEKEATELGKEIITPDVKALICTTVGLGLRLYPATSKAAPWAAGICSVLAHASDAVREVKEVRPRPADSVWLYEEISAPRPGDKDSRYVLRKIYLLVDARHGLKMDDIETAMQGGDKTIQAKLRAQLEEAQVNIYFLREKQLRFRLID